MRRTKDDWAELLERHKTQGGTIRNFCAENEIAVHQYYYRRQQVKDPEEVGFVEVRLDPVESGSGVDVDLQQLSVRLERGFDESVLRQVLRAAGAQKC